MTKSGPTTYQIKSTISVKMRAETGDEIFVSTGMVADGVASDDLENQKSVIDGFIDGWLKEKTETIGAAAFGGYAEDDGEAAAEDEEEAEEEEAEEEADLTEADINAMKKADLDALIEEHGLEIDPKAKLADKRAALIEALLGEEEEEEAEEEEAEEEEEEEAEEEAEFEPYTKAELSAMKLKEVDEIAAEWGLEIKHKAGADLKTKKATVVAALLKHQEEAAEE